MTRVIVLLVLMALAVTWHILVNDRLRQKAPLLLHVKLGFEPQFAALNLSKPAQRSQQTQSIDRDVLFYNVRAKGNVQQLKGTKVDEDVPLGQVAENLEGRIETLEAGRVTGWACIPGIIRDVTLQAVIYIDGVLVGEAPVTEETPHPIIHRMCEVDHDSPVAKPKHYRDVGFRYMLPRLLLGSHELRVFVRKEFDWTAKQELPQSPIRFVEAVSQPAMQKALDAQQALHRSFLDQISDRWPLQIPRKPAPSNHTQLQHQVPWWLNNSTRSFANRPHNSTLLAAIGVNSGVHSRERRDKLRWTWFNSGRARTQMALDLNIISYFVIGYSPGADAHGEELIRREMQQHGDILRVDAEDTHENLSEKTLKLFTLLSEAFPADFYFKVDDDVAVNMEAFAHYLSERRGYGNLYMGCMKSGPVNTDQSMKYYEPESWRFGESPYWGGGAINYMRHASGQIYGMSAPLAAYLASSGDMLHRFANEDVTVGAWLVGLEVQHVHDTRFCCEGKKSCYDQSTPENVCLSYYEQNCAGICNATTRLEPIYWMCIADPLKTGANAWWKLNKEAEKFEQPQATLP